MFIAESQLDFHEFGRLTHFEIEKILSEYLEDEHASGADQVLIITGKGSVIRPLVKKLLSSNKLVDCFKQAGYYNGQGGAFEVNIAV